MEHINYLQQQLGLMTWPLILCSFATVMIVLERLMQLCICSGRGRKGIHAELKQISPSNVQQITGLAEKFSHRRPPLYQGVSILLQHHCYPKILREDTAGMWLEEKRLQLNSGLRLLGLIGVISPLIGLLGTVLGLIEMFKGVATSSGNITPNDLADGLGIAMRTTAAGLFIALPAIASAQLLGLWADKVMAKLEHTLNFTNLWLEGVEFQQAKTQPSPVSHEAIP
ncbi:MotA/TolQ/ExbB proton channel family protein [Vibrio aquimaris]|uniref:Colicin uptake protein TolQ n=1 Tax=Vibrio aquimaris TaxID=2587862 RepID=A0A5P9CR17_9VIBR|nr:MotA/TolQ/ExbB proton channel family protein [Vibrio aquimaris]QFT28646.1 colicin uptake protein TolQ [Vibrio aquimaris]